MNLLIFNLAMDPAHPALGFTNEWVNALAAKCERVWVITMLAGNYSVPTNVSVCSVGKERGYSEARRLATFYVELRRLLARERIDVCFAHMMPLFAVLGWPLLRARRVPIVLWHAHAHVAPLLRLATALATRVVTSGKTGFGISTPKLRVLSQGIDTERFAPAEARAERGAQLILSVGRISRAKHLDVALQAFGRLSPARRSNCSFKLIGDPLTVADRAYAAELTELVRRLDIEAQVQFQPALPFAEVPRELQRADLFVNVSSTNSIDKAVLEAMSAGVPVLTTNPAFARILEGRLAASFIDAADPVATLAERFEQLLSMPAAARRELGQELREVVVAQHSLTALRDRLLAELTDCAAGVTGGPAGSARVSSNSADARQP